MCQTTEEVSSIGSHDSGLLMAGMGAFIESRV